MPPGDLLAALDAQRERVAAFVASVGPEFEEFRYAPGKWTVREVVRHVAETERVLGYRLLRFARGDRTPLPGFDEEAFIEGGRSDPRTAAELGEEFDLQRRANLSLFGGMTDEILDRRGNMWGKETSVLSLLCIVYGHAEHHLAVLSSRYLDA